MGNTSRIFAMLRESSESPVVFSHGGARRGDSYKNRKENNIRLVLAERLGKSVTTINKYLNHGEFLSEAALQTLINAGVKKGFFEAIQKDKQQLIDDLKSDQKSHDEIVNAVSARVLSWLEQFQARDLPEIVSGQNEEADPPAVQSHLKKDSVKPAADKPIKHKHWGGNPSPAQQKEQTEDEIYQEFIAVGRLLIETAENKGLATQDRIKIFSDQVIRQSLLIQKLEHLLAQQITEAENQG
jgi:hypothetical protein